jgi:hypothetical protein
MHNALALFVCMMSDEYNRSNLKFPFSGFASYMSSGGTNSALILVQSICMQISTKYVILCKFYWGQSYCTTGECLIMCDSAKHVKGTYDYVITIISNHVELVGKGNQGRAYFRKCVRVAFETLFPPNLPVPRQYMDFN